MPVTGKKKVDDFYQDISRIPMNFDCDISGLNDIF